MCTAIWRLLVRRVAWVSGPEPDFAFRGRIFFLFSNRLTAATMSESYSTRASILLLPRGVTLTARQPGCTAKCSRRCDALVRQYSVLLSAAARTIRMCLIKINKQKQPPYDYVMSCRFGDPATVASGKEARRAISKFMGREQLLNSCAFRCRCPFNENNLQIAVGVLRGRPRPNIGELISYSWREGGYYGIETRELGTDKPKVKPCRPCLGRTKLAGAIWSKGWKPPL